MRYKDRFNQPLKATMTTNISSRREHPHNWLVLDVGDVIISTYPDEQYYALASVTGHCPGYIKQVIGQTNLIELLETGHLSTDDFARSVSQLLCVEIPTSLIRQSWLQVLGDVNEMLILSIKNERKSIVLASNTCEIHWREIEKRLAKYDLPYFAWLSFEVGVRKPNKAFYLNLLSGLHCKPSETLFIDDHIENLAAAGRLGIATYHHQCTTRTAAFILQYRNDL